MTAGSAAAGRGAPGPAAAGSGATATTGIVKLVDGATVYVTESNGTVVKVSTGPTSTISVTQNSKVADLRPGDNISVIGSPTKVGAIQATAIQDSGASGTNPIQSSSSASISSS